MTDESESLPVEHDLFVDGVFIPAIEDEYTCCTVSTKIIVVPPFSFHNFLIIDRKEDHRVKLVNTLKFLSLFFFLFGGVFYIITATWEYLLKKNEVKNESDVAFAMRILVDFLYGFGYLITGVIDIWIARVHKSNISNLSNDLGNELLLASLSTIATNLTIPLISVTSKGQLQPSANGWFKISRDVLIGIFVVIAGALDAISSLLTGSYEMMSTIVFLVASVLWFLLAVVAVLDISLCRNYIHSTGENLLKSNFKLVWYLNKSGDILFLIGASIDLICAIFWLFEDNLQIYSWTVVSAVCWTLDALLYILSACIFERQQGKE